jgi:predicted ATPase
LNDALSTVKGYTAPEVEKTVLRARELCQQLGETPQLFPVLWRLVLFYGNRGELQTALELAEQMMRLAQSIQDPYLLSLAHRALAWTLFRRGEVVSVRTHLEQALALYDPQPHPRPTFYMADPRVECLSYAAETLWYLGYPDQALKRSQEALALAEGLSNPLNLTIALEHAALFHLLRQEGPLARERAEEVITLATEQGFPAWLAYGMVAQGSALAGQGQVEEGIAQIQQGLAACRAMGLEMVRAATLPRLAAAYAKVGRIEEGLTLLAEALAFADKTGMHMGEAALYVLKGWFLLARSRENQAEAEACFHQALEVARRQSAKSLELRAVMSLSRLWQKQGKKDEARQLLAEIYNWFTEGFDTKDLQEAKALLEELS